MSATSSVCCNNHDPSWKISENVGWCLPQRCLPSPSRAFTVLTFPLISSHLVNCAHSPTVLLFLYLVDHISAKPAAHRRSTWSTHSFSGQQPNVRHLCSVTVRMLDVVFMCRQKPDKVLRTDSYQQALHTHTHSTSWSLSVYNFILAEK